MRALTRIGIVLTCTVLVPPAAYVPLGAAAHPGASSAQTEGPLPEDVHPDSRNRLPGHATNSPGGPIGAAAIRLYGSGVNVRWESPLGRPLTELAILTTAREHDQPYEWSLHEMEAVAVGLDPAVIDVVRHRGPVTGLADREAALITFGRELFGMHTVSAETYANAVRLFGNTNLVDLVGVMGQHAADATLLIAFDQHLPAGQQPLLTKP